jgi:hypothetical protein
VFPGSSGSPVFAASNVFRTAASGNFILIGSRMLYLGVIAEYLNIEERGEVEWKPISTVAKAPTYVMSQALNLGIVHKSSTVIETIEDWLKKYGASFTSEP